MATLQFKRGSTATLMNYATPPAAGEPIWDKDLCKLKVGDGETLYPNLPYVGEFEVELDGKSVVYNNQQLITLFGFENAQTNQVPAKGADGNLVWITVSSQDVIDSINERINEVDERVDELFSDIFGADGIEGRLDAVEETLEAINPQAIEEALETISQVDDRLDDMQADIGQLKDRADAVDIKNEEQDDRLTALEQNSMDLENDVFIIFGGNSEEVMVSDHHYEGDA